MKRWMRAALVASVLVLPVAGCSSGGSKSDDNAKTSTTAVVVSNSGSKGSVTPQDKGETYTNVQDPQGSVDGYVGAKDDAKVTTCDSVDGVLQVKGTVTNPTDEDQQYRIYVTSMEKGNITRGVAQVDTEPVAAKATAEWGTIIKLPDTDLTCVLRVERFAPLG